MKLLKLSLFIMMISAPFFASHSAHPNTDKKLSYSNEQTVDFGPIYVGHGMQKNGSLSHDKINFLKKKYKDHPILREAFTIMEGADLALAYDMTSLLGSIKNHTSPFTPQKLYDLMEFDDDIISNTTMHLHRKNAGINRPLIDLLHNLGSYKAKDKNGIINALALIKQYGDQLWLGQIPTVLKNVTGNEAIDLRLALFYIDLFKRKSLSLKKRGLATFKTFYPIFHVGKDPLIDSFLKQTSFYEDGKFYGPSNGYVKNADASSVIDLDAAHKMPLKWDSQDKLLNYPLVMADCSGFAQAVTRRFHKNNELLQKKRQMSYHLAPLYDHLANQKMHTTGKMYDINGKTRNLTQNQKEQIIRFIDIISKLQDVYEPVINPIKNIQPGDIIVQRGSSEGHVMLAVEQSSENPHKIIVVELTSGKGNGYNWTEKELLSGRQGGKYHRVLRIKQPKQHAF